MDRECELDGCCHEESYQQKHMLAMLDYTPVANAYCSCGRIVFLDRSVISLKIALGKEIQCMSCRNARISKELDTLNDIYNRVVEEVC